MQTDTIRSDKYENALVDIGKVVNPLLAKAQAQTIKTSNDMAIAADVLVDIKKRSARLEEVRKFFTKPMNDQVKRINNEFKKTSMPLEEAEWILKNKISDYRGELERKRMEEEKKLQEEVAKKNEKLEVKLAKPVIAEAPKTVVGKEGKVSTSKVWTFRITREKMIPREFLTIDEQAIRQAVRGGARKISGVKIYQKEIVNVRT